MLSDKFKRGRPFNLFWMLIREEPVMASSDAHHVVFCSCPFAFLFLLFSFISDYLRPLATHRCWMLEKQLPDSFRHVTEADQYQRKSPFSISKSLSTSCLHLFYISEDEEGPHFWASVLFTVPTRLACSSQYFAINVSLSERPRGWCVVQCTSTEPVC